MPPLLRSQPGARLQTHPKLRESSCPPPPTLSPYLQLQAWAVIRCS